MVGAGDGAATSAGRPARGAAGTLRTSTPATLRGVRVSRIIECGTLFDYPDPIAVSQGIGGNYSGPPTTRMMPRSIATLLSERRTDARTSNSPAGRLRIRKK